MLIQVGPGEGAGVQAIRQILDLVEPTSHCEVDELPAATVTMTTDLVSQMKELRGSSR